MSWNDGNLLLNRYEFLAIDESVRALKDAGFRAMLILAPEDTPTQMVTFTENADGVVNIDVHNSRTGGIRTESSDSYEKWRGEYVESYDL